MLRKLFDAICGQRVGFFCGCIMIGTAPVHFAKDQVAFGVFFGLYGCFMIAINWRR